MSSTWVVPGLLLLALEKELFSNLMGIFWHFYIDENFHYSVPWRIQSTALFDLCAGRRLEPFLASLYNSGIFDIP